MKRTWPLLSGAASLASLAYSWWLYSQLPDRWLRWLQNLLSKPDQDSPPFDLMAWVDADLSMFLLTQSILAVVAIGTALSSAKTWQKALLGAASVGAISLARFVANFAVGVRADLAPSEGYRFTL